MTGSASSPAGALPGASGLCGTMPSAGANLSGPMPKCRSIAAENFLTATIAAASRIAGSVSMRSISATVASTAAAIISDTVGAVPSRGMCVTVLVITLGPPVARQSAAAAFGARMRCKCLPKG